MCLCRGCGEIAGDLVEELPRVLIIPVPAALLNGVFHLKIKINEGALRDAVESYRVDCRPKRG
jgi:hypothetical protein